MTPEIKRIIDELADKNGDTQATVMRRAVALLKTVKEAEQRGQAPALIDKDGNVTAQLIGV